MRSGKMNVDAIEVEILATEALDAGGVLRQLDFAYDIYGMPGSAIVDLLPREFDARRGGRSTLR